VSPGAGGAADDEVPIRRVERRERADEWALVLAAEGLHPRVTRAERGFVLSTPALEAERAGQFLAEWERENPAARGAPRVRPTAPEPAAWQVAVLAATALLGFFRITGPSGSHNAWFEVGASDAGLVLAGQLWRVVTALTLHVDLTHVLGNCLAGAFFLTALGRSYGPGVGLALAVAAGALGNLANAFVHAGDHHSVGASTAIFGAVGVLAGSGVRHSHHGGTPVRRIWLPIGAGLALVAMLGTGERADIWAHVMGVLCGTALGLLTGAGHRPPGGTWTQWAAGTATLAAVLASWAWGFDALRSGGEDALVSGVDAPRPAPPPPPPLVTGADGGGGPGAGAPALPDPAPPAPVAMGAAAVVARSAGRRRRRVRRRVKRALLAPALALAGWIAPALYRGYMALVWRTSRVVDLGVSDIEGLCTAHHGVVALLWHEEVAMAPYAYPRLGFRPDTLASLSDSGQLVTRVLESCGYRVFRGGSSRRGSRRRLMVLETMVDHMRERDDVIYGITVDGSHGPAYRMKSGGAFIARRTGRPVVLVRTWARRQIRLGSWDRLAIPLPWNEIRHSMRGPYPVPDDADTREGFERYRARLEADLLDLAAESYAALDQPEPPALRAARSGKTR